MGIENPGNSEQGRSLAGSVRPEQAGYLSLAGLEIQPFECFDRAITRHDVVDFQHGVLIIIRLAKVGLLDGFIFLDSGRFTLGNLGAEIQYRDAVGNSHN